MNVDMRIAPHNLDAECAVLGAFFLTETAEKILPLLQDEHFYDPRNQEIYRAIRTLCENQRGVDPLTIAEELANTGSLDRVGGIGYVSSLEQYVIHPRNTYHHAKIVLQHFAARNMIRMSQEMSEAGYVGKSALDVLPAAMSKMQRILDQQTESRCADPSELAQDTWEVLSAEQGCQGVLSGLDRLDRCLYGFQPGSLNVLAARPSVGKTALAVQFARHAVMDGHSVMIVEMEMPKEQLMARMAAMHTGTSLKLLREHRAGEQAMLKVRDFLGLVQNTWKLYINDECGLDPVDIETQASIIQQKYGLDLLVVDFLQLLNLRNKDRSMNRNLEIGHITWRLKKLARDLNIPILLLAQLSRDVEKRATKILNQRPKLSDLRDSGEIEQHADVVMFLHRLTKPDGNVKGTVDLLVEKHRQGPLTDVPLYFLGGTTEFYPRGDGEQAHSAEHSKPYRDD
ncbi:replicative DNA helicase [bacterium]|nr:replicative DNA helicase [bacterium]